MSKYVVVTGASRGLGLELCQKLIEQDYHVVALSRTLSAALGELDEKYESLHFIKVDLSHLDELPLLCRTIIHQYGRPYGLINNAAVGHDGVLATMPNTDIDSLIKLNIQSPILLTKYLARSMLLNRNGRVVNISSIVAKTGFNGLSVYAATKSALEGFSKSFAREVGKAGITVNCVAPGYLETAMTQGLQEDKLESIQRRSPMRKLASLSDVSDAVLFLLGNGASSITGTVLTVDAGSTA